MTETVDIPIGVRDIIERSARALRDDDGHYMIPLGSHEHVDDDDDCPGVYDALAVLPIDPERMDRMVAKVKEAVATRGLPPSPVRGVLVSVRASLSRDTGQNGEGRGFVVVNDQGTYVAAVFDDDHSILVAPRNAPQLEGLGVSTREALDTFRGN